MAERKVIIKYYPKNFNHEIIVKRGRGKDKLMMVRNMLPMSLRCNTCANYLYIGTKFNMRMEICNEETYLGIKVFRFYFKCTYCYGQITFKTDPKNHDYVVEAGGTRNYEAIKDAQVAEKYLKKLKVNEKEGDSMKYLENKSYDSKREMELMEALEDIKNLNKRQAVIDPEDLLQNLIYQEEEREKVDEEEEAEDDRRYEELRQQIRAEKSTGLDRVDEGEEEEGEKAERVSQEQIEGEKVKGEMVKMEGANLDQKLEEDRQPQKRATEQRLDWRSMLPANKRAQAAKPKVKSALSNMKKKIIKSGPKGEAKAGRDC